MAPKAEVVFEPVSAGSRVLASTQAGSVLIRCGEQRQV
jgi:hypothetical protein